MRTVKIRIQGDNEQDAQDARRLLEIVTQGACKLMKPREGTNPKYEGRQKWAAYGEMEIERLLIVVEPQEAENGKAATGATIRISQPRKSRKKT